MSTKSSVSQLVAERAAQTGELPHEILLRAARGEPFITRKEVEVGKQRGYAPPDEADSLVECVEEIYYPTYHEQIDAAKAAAPYYVPRLATQIIKAGDGTADTVVETLKQLAAKLPV